MLRKQLDSQLIEDQNHQTSDNCTQTNKQKVNAKFNNVCKNIVQRMWRHNKETRKNLRDSLIG